MDKSNSFAVIQSVVVVYYMPAYHDIASVDTELTAIEQFRIT